MEYVTAKEAAEYLNISRARVLVFISDGRLKAEKAGNTWLILRSDLEEFSKQPRPEGWQKGRPRKSVSE